MACRDAIPGILSDQELLEHQGLLGSGYYYLVQVERVVQSGLHLVVLSTDVEVELALLRPYNNTLDKVNPLSTANLLREAVEALERHITDRSGQSFNDYLFTRSLKVTQYFADLSGVLGLPINEGNIE